MSPWPPQLIWQHDVVMCTRFGISARRNSSMSSSIIDLTTPDASVPGMSQCSQPWVWEMNATEFCVPPTTNPLASSASISGSTFASSSTMYSMLLRMVKRTWPSAYSVADLAELAQGEDIEDALGAGAHRPDLLAAVGDVAQHPDPGMGVVLPLPEVPEHGRVHVLEPVRASRLDRHSMLLGHGLASLPPR